MLKTISTNQHGNRFDTRPTPAWFKNAKFGIFIHWESILYPCGHLKALTKNGINIGWIIKS